MSAIFVTGSSQGLGLELVKQYSGRVSETGGLVIATAQRCTPALSEAIAQSNGSAVFWTWRMRNKLLGRWKK
jgi:NAD(P)-dependent dehydrogenase (short-subunit alcohol dehydrogenase family)